MNPGVQLYATLLPSMGHFARFARDPRMTGLRLNTPMLSGEELDLELGFLDSVRPASEVFFDVKGRQLRVLEAHDCGDHLEVVINHPISAPAGSLVLFKAGGDYVLLDHVEADGLRLVFQGGPEWMVKAGESFHVVSNGFVRHGDLFNPQELERIERAKAAGITRWLLSYTESMADVNQLLEVVGSDAELWLKIENDRGLQFVEHEFEKRPNLTLVAARGDLYVEAKPKHDILRALRLIIDRDPAAVAGSRILLSVAREPEVSCADLSELAWLREIGYYRFMLCDELCLDEDWLGTAIDVFESVMDSYVPLHPVKTDASVA